MSACNIPSVDLIEAFDAPSFENTRAVRWMHAMTPRFGHSRNLLLLMQGTEEDQQDYLRGLLASSIAIFCFFLVWMILLIVFRCMGPNETGMLSGKPRPLPPKPHTGRSDAKSSKEKYEQKDTTGKNSNDRWARIDLSGSLTDGTKSKEPSSKQKTAADSLDKFMAWERGNLENKDEPKNEEASGESPKASAAPPSQELAAWERQHRKAQKWMTFWRFVVCFCGTSIIISSILMANNGVSSLTQSLDNGRESIAIARGLTIRGMELIDTVTEQNLITGEAVDDLLLDINGMCPLLRPDGLCTDLDDLSTCDFDDILDNNILITTIKHFKDADESIYYKELVNARQDLEDFRVLLRKTDNTAVQFNWALYCAMVGSLILAGLCLLIMVGVVFRKYGLLDCLRNWFLIPSFAILVALSFFFSMLFIIGSMAVADLCIDSPDGRILTILARFQEQLSPMVVDIASFYINECPPDAIPQDFSQQIAFLLDAMPALGDFSALIESSAGSFQEVCGFEDSENLSAVADTAEVQLCQIVEILDQIRLFFQCRNWFPLYESTFYDAICYNGTDGFAWVASTQFVIVFFSCVLLTLRAAFDNVSIEESHDEERSNGSSTVDDTYDKNKKAPSTPPRGAVKEVPKSPPRVITSTKRRDEFELSLEDL